MPAEIHINISIGIAKDMQSRFDLVAKIIQSTTHLILHEAVNHDEAIQVHI